MDTLTRLKNVPLFASATPETLALVAELVTNDSYAKGSFLCQQGDLGETLYVIDSGEAIIHQQDVRGRQRPLGYLRAGNHFGQDVLLSGSTYHASIRATTDVEALCIRKRDFDLLLQEHPQIRNQLTVNQPRKTRLHAPMASWQDQEEELVLLRKRHWFVFVSALRFPLFTLLILAIIVWFLRWLSVNVSPLVSSLSIGAIPAIMTLWVFADWQNDYYLVTTTRVLHREKAILMSETIDEIPLDKIQGTYITRDLLGKMLGFGTLQLHTASARGSIVLDYLPDPEGVQDVIRDQITYLTLRVQQGERERIRQEILQQTRRTETEDGLPAAPFPYQKQSRRASLNLREADYDQTNQVIWRKHWVYLITRVFLPLPTVLLLTVTIALAAYRWPIPYGAILLPASLALWIPSIIWLWWEVEDWRNDVYILTDRLIIDVEKKPLFFSEQRRQATLDMIQNVSLRVPGPLAAILNYGNVLIETAGPTGAFTFDGVSRPAAVQREIFRRVEAYSDTERRRQKEQRIAEFSDWFHVYHEVDQRQQPPDSS